ncbi:MAG: exo-alpha-sialidase [Sphingobacterium sp.]
MKSLKHLIALFIFSCLLTSLGFAGNITVTYYQLPLLVGEKSTPLIRLSLIADQSDVGKTFSDLRFSFQGTTDIKNIRNIKIYLAQSDSSIMPKLNPSQIIFDQPAGELQHELKLDYKVEKAGVHNFWVTLGIGENADLLNKITLRLQSAKLGENALKGSYAQKREYRLALPIRQHMQDGVHTSRIPGLSTSNDGTLLAIYDARYESARDLQGHMDIAVQRSFDKGQSWEPIQIALDMKQWGDLPEKFNGVSDAAILVDKKSGAIFIAGLWSHGVINDEGIWVEGLTDTSTVWNHQWKTKGSGPGFDVKQTSQFLITKSTDDGKTWSAPVNLTRQCKKEEWWLWAPAPGRGITMADGTLVFPSQGRDENGVPFSNITYSKDGGKTWQTSSAAVEIDKGTTECAVVELRPGELMLNMRANRNRGLPVPDNGRAIATTKDFGKTWQQHHTSLNTLIEPTCMASLHKHRAPDNKEILFFCNPHSTSKRNNISVQASFDYGDSWAENIVLLDEWSGRGYSCITSVDEQTIGVIYEGSQSDMVFQKIKVDEFYQKK